MLRISGGCRVGSFPFVHAMPGGAFRSPPSVGRVGLNHLSIHAHRSSSHAQRHCDAVVTTLPRWADGHAHQLPHARTPTVARTHGSRPTHAHRLPCVPTECRVPCECVAERARAGPNGGTDRASRENCSWHAMVLFPLRCLNSPFALPVNPHASPGRVY